MTEPECLACDNPIEMLEYAHDFASDHKMNAATKAFYPQQALHSVVPILRDILGNPFRPVSLDPSWLTSTVVTLANHIYAERAFDRLPILADALQDAGCDNADVLNHCRSDGPHARGCWVVDLLTGRE